MSRGTARLGATLARWMVLLPVTGMLLVAAASPASAEISGIGDDATVDKAGTLNIRANFDGSANGEENRLGLVEPGRTPVTVDSVPFELLRGGSLAYDFNTQCWVPSAPDSPCTSPKPARNGTWIVEQFGGARDTVRFRLRIPPAAPAEVKADSASLQEMRVTWRRGAEPDLTTFDVFEGDQRVKRDLAVDDVCDDKGACSAAIPAEGIGERNYTVSAFRSDGAGGVVESPQSAKASGTLLGPIAPPAPGDPAPLPGADASPTPSGSASPGPSGSPTPVAGRTSPPRSTAEQAAAQRKSFSSGFNAFAPKLGIPKLPPLPQSQEPALAALPDGTFEPTLGFDDQILTEENADAEPRATTGVRGAVTNLVDSEQLAKSTAGALVLLLTGAHLRRWLGATSED